MTDISNQPWQLLDTPGGPHMQFLSRNYVPMGLVDMIELAPKRVLDVGCFFGETGALIKQRYPSAWVIGIEPIQEAAENAAKRIDQVEQTTLEEIDFAVAGIAKGSIDTVILADVLEHMYNPWRALEKIKPLLSEEGIILASIPNIRNLMIIQQLVNGVWHYEGAGILDITHIRFFTKLGIVELFTQTGYHITELNYNIDPRCQQLLQTDSQDQTVNISTDKFVIKEIKDEDVREFATLQFFIRAIPTSSNLDG